MAKIHPYKSTLKLVKQASILCLIALLGFIGGCKAATNSNENKADNDAKGSNGFNGSCSMTSSINTGATNTIQECWEMYNGTTAAAKSTCDVTNDIGGAGTSVVATFSAGPCKRTTPMIACKVPFVKQSYEILFQYTQTEKCNKGTVVKTPSIPSANGATDTSASTVSVPSDDLSSDSNGAGKKIPLRHKEFSWGVCDEITSKYASTTEYPVLGPCPDQISKYGSKKMGCKTVDPISIRWCYGTSCDEVNLTNQCRSINYIKSQLIDSNGNPINSTGQ